MRLLVITHAFPPSRHSNAKRPWYLAQGFLDAGWEVEVLTSPLGMEFGEGEKLAHRRCRVIRWQDPVHRLQRWVASWPALGKALGLAANGLLWPDFCALWARAVCRECLRRGGEHDRVLAFVFPPSVLLSGSYGGLVGPRWTFDFQESVTPQFRRRGRRSPLQQALLGRLERLERKTLHLAGRVVFTAESNRQAYLAAGLVPAATTAHVPYFYDAAAFRGPGEVTADFEIAYFGNFDLRGDRNPETFLRSLARFLEREPGARAVTRFRFHGNWIPEHDRHLDELDLRDVASIQPMVGYDDYVAGLKRSPVLLLVVAAEHNLFMPSKIVDYFGARRPILAFVPRDSEMRRVLEAAGMAEFASDERDVASGAAAIGRLWRLHREGRLAEVAGETGFWSSEHQVPRYVGMLAGGIADG